jgi:hypothetical protein
MRLRQKAFAVANGVGCVSHDGNGHLEVYRDRNAAKRSVEAHRYAAQYGERVICVEIVEVVARPKGKVRRK